MHVLLSLFLFCTPLEVEVSTGMGGIVWEQPPGLLPAMTSSSMTAWSVRVPWRGPWMFGSTLLLNAYDGRHPDFDGPLFGVVDAMILYRMEMGAWQLNLGAGVGAGALFSYRFREEAAGGVPPGRYELFMPSLYAAIQGAFLRRVHPRLLVGVSLRYYSGINSGPCWEGPVVDCENVDRETQHWSFGASVVLVEP